MSGAETNVYIDGFNFYYGAVKGTPWKWLDFDALVRVLLRGHTIGRIKYFTSRVEDRPGDPNQSQRQDVYIRALDSFDSIDVHFGEFRTNTKRVRLAKKGKPKYAQAYITEEKGADVKLASHLVWDAAHKDIGTAFVISNDSDLQEPIDMAKALEVPVIVMNPHRHKGQADHLHGSDRRNLRKGHLEHCQLPNPLLTADGQRIHMPPTWA